MRREDAIEQCNLENLLYQACLTADPEFASFILQLLANGHERAKAHAANVGEVPHIDNYLIDSLRDPGFALCLERGRVFRVHPSADLNDDPVSHSARFDGHVIRIDQVVLRRQLVRYNKKNILEMIQTGNVSCYLN